MAIKYKVVEYKNDEEPWTVYNSIEDVRKEPDTVSLRKGDTAKPMFAVLSQRQLRQAAIMVMKLPKI